MKHCNHCKIDVNSQSNYCPLCFNKMEENDIKKPNMLDISKEKPTTNIKNHMVRKVFLLLSLSAILITGFINYFTSKTPWSLVIFFGIVYLWIFVKHTIMSNRHIFEKFALQFLGLVTILITSNYISGGGHWFVDYVLPSMFIMVLFVMNLMLFIHKKRRHFEISFLIFELFLLVACIIFVCIDYCSFKTLYLISLIFSAISMAGIIIMDGKNLYQEIVKKFHL